MQRPSYRAEASDGTALTAFGPDGDGDSEFVVLDPVSGRYTSFYLGPDDTAGLGDFLRHNTGSLAAATEEHLRDGELPDPPPGDTRATVRLREVYGYTEPDQPGPFDRLLVRVAAWQLRVEDAHEISLDAYPAQDWVGRSNVLETLDAVIRQLVHTLNTDRTE